MYELIIIGGGPGAVAAGVYAARKKIKTLLIAESFGGQSLVSAGIENWIGTRTVTGFDFAKMLEDHVRAQEDIEIIEGDIVTKILKTDKGFSMATRDGKTFETENILLASGSRRRTLGIPGEEKLNGKGVVYCSTCDAPIFKDKIVAVVGGGNAGFEAVLDLIPYAKKIYVLERTGAWRGDALTLSKIQNNPKVEMILNAESTEILGDNFVTGLRYKDLTGGEIKELKLDGVFVEIGSIPNTDFVKDLVSINQLGEIIVDHKTQQTSVPGIWAVGDVSDVLYKQNNISAGDAVKAVLNIFEKISKK